MPNFLYQSFVLLAFSIYFCYSAPLNVTTPTTCDSAAEMAKAQKCYPMMMEFGNKTVELAALDMKINDTRLLSMMKLCKDLKACLNSSCHFEESMKKDVRIACDGIALKNTYFMECLTKIKTGTPNLVQYTCLAHSSDQMFTTKKWCTKSVFRGVCGERSLNNFDRHCRIMVRLFGLADKDGDDEDDE
ncbi:hypothetical protein CAEBREN_24587 [Caenorhabditis brenneri]|uniref:T20D4.11-like domain-containing protein n=1 Tax=Caenorhabditis brenneri TaxID=135651 RepID=G0M9U6_CAEBE|nr:hypothetical protein CAEBREN_24587 [Caenorhabditis brenneri]